MRSVSVWKMLELDFISSKHADNPYAETSMDVTFMSPSGQKFKVPGFWDGERRWKARFAPNAAGEWTWTTVSRDEGLDGKRGSFTVTSYDGANRIYRHGFLRTGDRHFIHDDGKPFFWLGDTVWSVSAHAHREEWQQYVSFRSNQGFNVLQINSLPQWDASGSDFRRPFADQDGDYDYMRPNPEYFQYLDRLMEDSVEEGLFTAMVVLWFNYVPETNLSWNKEWGKPMDERAASAYGAYLSARYSAFGTVWLISGDSDYESSLAESIYDAAAKAVRAASPYQAVCTAHLNGGLYTPKELNRKEWLDFHMFQSCHFRNSADNAIYYAEKDRDYFPARPVLNGEPCYDSLKLMDPDNTENRLIDREFVRETAWVSVLCGANAGFTYGAHGLWPWHREGQEYEAIHYGLPLSWQAALQLPSGNDMIRLKQLMETLAWWEMVPFRDVSSEIEDVRIAASSTPDLRQLVVYVGKRTDVILHCKLPVLPEVVWMNPVDGSIAEAMAHPLEIGFLVSAAAWPEDAVLIMRA